MFPTCLRLPGLPGLALVARGRPAGAVSLRSLLRRPLAPGLPLGSGVKALQQLNLLFNGRPKKDIYPYFK